MKLRGVKAAIGFVVAGSVIGLIFNSFNSSGIPLLAKPLPSVSTPNTTMTGQPADSSEGIHMIDLAQAKLIYDQGIPFIDAREEDEFDEGHIKGAYNNSNYQELLFNLDMLQGRDKLVITYCNDPDCGLSKTLAYDLQSSGFTHILVFEGGWDLWKEAGYPVELSE